MDDDEEVHAIIDNRCGQVAFYYYGPVPDNGALRPEFAMLPDGGAFDPNVIPLCGSCGKSLVFEQMLVDGDRALIDPHHSSFAYYREPNLGYTKNALSYRMKEKYNVWHDELSDFDKAKVKEKIITMLELRALEIMMKNKSK